MVALAVSASNSKADNGQAEEASPFAQLTVDQRKCIFEKVQANSSILVSIQMNIFLRVVFSNVYENTKYIHNIKL